ncbi:MAG: zinc-binding dehydrogenase [Ignavibacteriaceae bacterium]
MTRQVYFLKRAGSINNMKLLEQDLPEPARDEVTVEIKSIGLNFADIFSILGLYKAAPKFNLIPGLEFSGIVIKKGENVKEFSIGDRVYGATKFGGYVSHINIDQSYLLKLPNDWTFEEGASFIVQSLTAYYALVVLGEVNQNKTVLIHSAAGGVGLNANRIAKKFSAFTIGTIGNKSKIELLKSEGYDRIIVRDKNLKRNIQEALGSRPLDIVLEAVGSKVFKISFNLLTHTGRIIVYGAGAYSTGNSSNNLFKLAYKFFTRPKVDPLRMIEQNRAVMAFNLIWIYERGEYLRKLLDEVIKLNLPKPIINHTFSFDALPDAVRALKSGKTTGKVVVKVNQ